MTVAELDVRLKFCRYRAGSGLAWTTFEDGSTCSNWVPRDDVTGAVDPGFMLVAAGLGYDDPWPYLVAHELLHSLVPEMLFDRPGYVVRMMARGRKCDLAGAYAEERLIHHVAVLMRFPGLADGLDPTLKPVAMRARELLCNFPGAVGR